MNGRLEGKVALSAGTGYVTGALWRVDGGITVAKGPVGDQVPEALTRQPEDVLDLDHALDGRTS